MYGVGGGGGGGGFIGNHRVEVNGWPGGCLSNKTSLTLVVARDPLGCLIVNHSSLLLVP